MWRKLTLHARHSLSLALARCFDTISLTFIYHLLKSLLCHSLRQMFVLMCVSGQEAGRLKQSPMSSELPGSEWVLWILASSFAVPGGRGAHFVASQPGVCGVTLFRRLAELRFQWLGDVIKVCSWVAICSIIFSSLLNITTECNELILCANLFFQALVTSSSKYKIWIQICMCSSVPVSVRQGCKPRVCVGKKDKQHEGVSSTPENYKI